MRKGDFSMFQHGVDLLRAPRITYLENYYDRMVWFVLNNCPEVEPYIKYDILYTLLIFEFKNYFSFKNLFLIQK